MLGNIIVFGDSYSTFKGHIPEGYDYYYDEEGPYYVKVIDELELGENDVTKVEHTWWHSLANETGSLLLNCSWSGTTICNTGYNKVDNSDKSFIARLDKLIAENYFDQNKVDTVLLFGGTNDSWSDAPFGEKIYSGWTKEDLYCVFPAFTYFLDRITKVLPNADVYCILNTELKPEVVDFYTEAGKRYGAGVIELKDIEKIDGHPSVKGMNTIKDQILSYIKSK